MKNKSLTYFLVGLVAGALVFGVSYSLANKHRISAAAKDWNKLNLILSTVEANYVDDIDFAKVTDAGLTAMLQKLDPHSVYMLPEVLKEADQDLSGKFEGVGIVFNVPNDTAVVLSVVAGGPSDKAGITMGDRILRVDDMDIAGTKTPQDTMVRRMRGPKGTKVTLLIGRGEEKIPFEIVRDKIPEKCVTAAFMLDDSTAFIKLDKFSRTTFFEFITAAQQLQEAGMTRMILDLRDNTGGYLDQACNLANAFLPKDAQIVYMQGKHRSREDVKANGDGLLQDIKLAVIINEGSASASEIFAGAIQDNDRGVLVGRRSFGKGVVQEPFYLTDGSGVRLTVSRFYTPSGRCIQKPFTDDYAYDFYERYESGELSSADSIKVNKEQTFKTSKGRTVYGGGGIIPDVFNPMDTTKATNFYIQCSKKAAMMRYATEYFDKHRSQMVQMGDFDKLQRYMTASGIEADFLKYAEKLGIKAEAGEWEKSKQYMLPQLLGLCGRYSKLGEEAFYKSIYSVDQDIIMAEKNLDIALIAPEVPVE